MSKEAQLQQVMSALRKKWVVTQDAAGKWTPGVGRLAARIHELRKMGHTIETRKIPNTHNQGTHGRYFSIKEAKNATQSS